MLVVNVLQDFWDTLQFGEVFEVEFLFSLCNFGDGHINALFATEKLNYVNDRKPAQFVEALFGELASPLAERLFPGDVVQRHGVRDGAIAVKQVGIENSRRYGKLEVQLSVYFEFARFCAAELCERSLTAFITVLGGPT